MKNIKILMIAGFYIFISDFGVSQTSYQKVGDTTYGSDGKSCTKIGSATYCD